MPNSMLLLADGHIGGHRGIRKSIKAAEDVGTRGTQATSGQVQ